MEMIPHRDPRIEQIQRTIEITCPDVKIKFKDHSKLWSLVPSRWRRAASASWNTIWVTNEIWSKPAMELSGLLAHELQHVLDWRKNPIRYPLGYVFPQIIALQTLIAAIVLFHFSLLGGLAALLATFVALLPWPSMSRAQRELRGYVCNMTIELWALGEITERRREHVIKALRSWTYWKMIWSKNTAKKMLGKAAAMAHSGEARQQIQALRLLHPVLKITWGKHD